MLFGDVDAIAVVRARAIDERVQLSCQLSWSHRIHHLRVCSALSCAAVAEVL
jgi:hypothetical protein